jgi:hypothetical protein
VNQIEDEARPWSQQKKQDDPREIEGLNRDKPDYDSFTKVQETNPGREYRRGEYKKNPNAVACLGDINPRPVDSMGDHIAISHDCPAKSRYDPLRGDCKANHDGVCQNSLHTRDRLNREAEC